MQLKKQNSGEILYQNTQKTKETFLNYICVNIDCTIVNT